MEKIKLGISACLLGENVRYDGQHKLDRYLRDTLGRYVDFVPVCPEVGCGLPIPREAMRLVGDPDAPRLMTQKTAVDHTDRMQAWGAERLDELEQEDLCGYVFKSRSPSSGMSHVKVYSEQQGMPRPVGVGIWARMFMERFPLLPVEDEGRLHDARLRENFIQRIFVTKRWKELLRDAPSLADLMEFHARHKLLFMAHNQKGATELGRIVAHAPGRPLEEVLAEYHLKMQQLTALKSTVKKNVNVLHHLMGYFKRDISADEKQELLEVIGQYAREDVPLIVPITLINHYVRKYQQPYLLSQHYLNPHPAELGLRNHV